MDYSLGPPDKKLSTFAANLWILLPRVTKPITAESFPMHHTEAQVQSSASHIEPCTVQNLIVNSATFFPLAG
jgi:hypothetical protein